MTIGVIELELQDVSLSLLDRSLGTIAGTTGKEDVSTVGGKGDDGGVAKSAGCAGDDGDFSG